MSIQQTICQWNKRFTHFIASQTEGLKTTTHTLNPCRILLVSLSVNLVVFSLVLTFIDVYYETGDDIALMRISSGMVTGSPSEYLVFSNVIYGHFLKELYLLNSSVNWYTLGLLSIHFFGMTALLSAFLYKRPFASSVGIFLFFFMGLELRMLISMQFTSTALIGGASACLLILYSSHDSAMHSKYITFMAILLAIAAFMIRDKAGLLAFGFCLPLVGIETLRHRVLKSIMAYIITLSLFGAATLVHTTYYNKTDEWQSYITYNKVRGKLHDSPRFQYLRIQQNGMEHELENAGWSKNDHAMFVNWFYTDPEIYSKNHLDTLYKSFKHINNTFSQTLGILKKSAGNANLHIATALSLLLLALQYNPSRWKTILVLSVCNFTWILALCFYLAWHERLPDRIFIPAMAIAGSLCWLQALSEPNTNENFSILQSKVLKSILALGLVLVLILHVHDTHKRITLNLRHQYYYDKMISSLKNDFNHGDTPPVFIMWGWFFPHEWDRALSSFENYSKLNSLNLRWHIFSPHYDSALAKNNLQSPLRDLYTQDNVFLISGYYPNIVIKYAEEHQGLQLDAKLVKSYAHPENEIPPGHQKTMVFKLSPVLNE